MNCQEFTMLIIKETGQYNTYWSSVILSTVLESDYLKMSNRPCPTEAHNIEVILSGSS